MNENDIPRHELDDPHTFAAFERLEAARAERERKAERALTFGAPHRVTFAAPRTRVAKKAPAPITGALAQAQRATRAGNLPAAALALAVASIHAGDFGAAIAGVEAARSLSAA